MASSKMSTARSAGRIGPAEAEPRAAARRLAWACGVLGSVTAWIGWMSLAPSVGFPDVSPAGMLNLALRTDHEGAIGWAVLIAGLTGLAAGYLLAATGGLWRPALSSGALYGLALWLLTGAVLMPVMDLVSQDQSAAAAQGLGRMAETTDGSLPSPMRETFMMLHLGILAPIGALIAWLLFGGLLGATSSIRRRVGARR